MLETLRFMRNVKPEELTYDKVFEIMELVQEKGITRTDMQTRATSTLPETAMGATTSQMVAVDKISKGGKGPKGYKGTQGGSRTQSQAETKQSKWCGGPQFCKKDECPAKNEKALSQDVQRQ